MFFRTLLYYSITLVAASQLAQAQVLFLPASDVKPGSRAVGRTVFEDDKVEEFQVEILGNLENSGPGQTIILARLSGGPLDRTGVMQGMSGSPVYQDGKLIGAIALAFPFSKEPIAGIRPIEEMLAAGAAPRQPANRLAIRPPEPGGERKLARIAAPVSFSGFTERAIEQFAPQLRALGLEPRQGITGGASPASTTASSPLQPGSMISVQLLSGDMNLGADGTVTHIDGKRIYAFGHRFLSSGPTDIPFSRAKVITLLPNLSSSFKISSAAEWLGSITHDQNAAVVGELGRKAAMVPVEIEVNGATKSRIYRMQMVNDALLSPLLLQMAVFSTVEATERTMGSGTMEIKGTVEFEGDLPPVRFNNVYTGDFNVPLQVSLASALPVSYALQNSLDPLRLQKVRFELTPSLEKHQLQIENVWTSRREVRPGEAVDFNVLLTGPNGAEIVKRITYRVPIGAPAGTLYFTASDGMTANTTEYRQFGVSQPRPAREIVSLLNELRGNRSAHIRVWRADPSYSVQGQDLPDPPPSVGLILAKLNQGQIALPRTAKVAEFELPAPGAVVSGSKTAQVEVKEEMRTLLALLGASLAASAATTTSWELHTYNDFIKGRFSGLALTREGRVRLAPEVRTFFASGQPAIWSVAQAPDGTLYLGTGHKGRVVSLSKDGKPTTIFTASEPEIFSVAYGPDGAVYAGTSPNGKVYRINGGKVAEFFAPEERYIWSLAFGPDGSLYVGTGDRGKVYKVDKSGKGEIFYETGQAHITALALDAQGMVLAGSEPNGILYRISAKDKAFVLYDSHLPEIRSLAVAPDGAIYAAALGGSVAQRANAASSAAAPAATPVTAPTMSITVTDDGTSTQAGVDIKAKAEVAKSPAPAVAVPVAPSIEMMGIEKSALYRIHPDNRVDTVWTSKEENAYDLLLSGEDILLATDTQGRIYRLGPDRKPSMIAQTNEGETTRLLQTPSGVVAATGSTGKLLSLTNSATAGIYESPVHDASSVAKWGALAWRGSSAPKRQLVFRTRTGNSARPDQTWSDWSEPLTTGKGAQIPSPNARFIQWKAEFRGPDPTLESVVISYLPQNNPPAIRAFNVTTYTTGTAVPKTSSAGVASSPGTYSVTVTDTGEASSGSSAGTPSQTFGRSIMQQVFLSWQADDPDADRLLYSLYYRADDEQNWKLLRANFPDQTLSVDSDIFADGRYLFRLVVSDKAVNSSQTALETDALSVPVIFDNSPPAVTAALVSRNNAIAEIRVEASDITSPVRRAEYSLDAGTWTPLDPVDGILDSPRERFVLRIEKLSEGEHVVVIRIHDGANNAGLVKLVIR